jgi:hypothetical protein
LVFFGVGGGGRFAFFACVNSGYFLSAITFPAFINYSCVSVIFVQFFVEFRFTVGCCATTSMQNK